jgi:hypothetical protein
MIDYRAYLTPNIVKSFPQETDFPYEIKSGLFLPKLDLKPDVFEVDNQSSVPSCTANAATSVPEDILKKIGEGVSLSRLFNFWVSRNMILEQPGIQGSTMRAAIRAIKHFGVCRELLWPYDIPFVDMRPTDEAFAEASSRKIQRYEVIDSSLGGWPPINNLTEAEWRALVLRLIGDKIVLGVKSALNEGLQVAFSCQLGNQWFGLTGPWQEHIYTIPTNGGANPIVGGHAMVVIGYDDAYQRFLIENSWGPLWGDGGYGGMHYESFGMSFMEGFIIRCFDGIYINDPLQADFNKVQKMYKGYYQRPGDLGGLLYWRDRMIQNGFADIAEAFISSEESNILYSPEVIRAANRITRKG